jgi:pilus assembly protein CpaC
VVLLGFAAPVLAEGRDRIRIAVGRAEVVSSSDEVRTVAIAEPKIADAAVGSSRTVVVNAKSAGITTLVIYNEGARYKVYDVEVYVPNGDKQVAMHVRVAEVNDNAKRELGFDWFGEATKNGHFVRGGLLTAKAGGFTDDPVHSLTVTEATNGFLHYQHNSGSWFLQTTWKALEEHGDLRTLATPTLVARSGEPASFLAGGELPVPIAAASTGGQQNVTIQWKEFGVRLNFTPTIEEGNNIVLKVAPELSQLDFATSLQLSGFTVPALSSRKASTTVIMKSGEYLVIGGLKQTEKNKVVRRVPVLGYIPIVGLLFSHSRTENIDRDLLVVVSPEIVESESTLPRLPTDKK